MGQAGYGMGSLKGKERYGIARDSGRIFRRSNPRVLWVRRQVRPIGDPGSLKLTNLSNYDFVNPEVLRAKSELGTEVHGLTVLKDQMGDLDPTWIGERAVPYFAAYEQFVHEKHFVPDPDWTERAVIATIYGMKVGVTPDRFGKLAGTDTVIELKCVESPLQSWGFQTAIQEMAIYKTQHLGRAQRMALQLTKAGKYKIDPHTNHSYDASVAVAALTLVYARLKAGEKIWERV